MTVAEERSRFAYDSERDENGRFMACEFLIEGRAGGSTLIRSGQAGPFRHGSVVAEPSGGGRALALSADTGSAVHREAVQSCS